MHSWASLIGHPRPTAVCLHLPQASCRHLYEPRLNLPPLLYWATTSPSSLSPYFGSSHLPGPKSGIWKSVQIFPLISSTHRIPVVTETCTLSQGNPVGATHPRGPCPELSLSASSCNLPLPPFNSHSSFSSCLKDTVPQNTWRSNHRRPTQPSLLSLPHTYPRPRIFQVTFTPKFPSCCTSPGLAGYFQRRSSLPLVIDPLEIFGLSVAPTMKHCLMSLLRVQEG